MDNKEKMHGGFSLVEIMVTMILFAIIMIAGLSFLPFGEMYTHKREARLAAANLAYSIIEHLKETAIVNVNHFDAADLAIGSHTNPPADFFVPDNYDLSYDVTAGTWTTGGNTANYKKIAVSVTYLGTHALPMEGFVVQQ